MPRLRKPESAIDRLIFMKKAVETAQKNNQNGGSYLSQQTIEKLNKLITNVETGMGELGKSESIYQKEVREKNAALKVLQTCTLDFWEVLRRRVHRLGEPDSIFAYYQLPKSGNNPVLTTNGQWLETAALVVKGDSDAVTAGYAAMVNPSAAELSEKLEIARSEAEDVSEADKQLDLSQEAVSDQMPDVKDAIDLTIAELEFNLYDKDDAGKRRIMRNYGVRYEVSRTEVAEDDSDIQLN